MTVKPTGCVQQIQLEVGARGAAAGSASSRKHRLKLRVKTSSLRERRWSGSGENVVM